jgi:hypothetical protein
VLCPKNAPEPSGSALIVLETGNERRHQRRPWSVAGGRRKFDELALGLADGSLSGYAFKRYSADAILHRSRWHFTAERRDGACKYNNDWTAPLARWLEQKHPKYPRFFDG